MTTTVSITTATATTNTTAAGLLTEALEAAWDAIRAGMHVGGTNEYSEHYTDAFHSACQRLREAGEALEAAVEAAAKRLGVDMTAEVLEPSPARVACEG
jgi:hypothetical protein